MKKLIIIAIALASITSASYAAVKCVPTPNGGTCCWDTDRDGPFRPLGC